MKFFIWTKGSLMKYLLLILASLSPVCLAQDKRPNIIFILTDDQKYDAMGFMGHYPFFKKLQILTASAMRVCILKIAL